MKTKFETLFMEEAFNFLRNLDEKTQVKIIYNIDKAKQANDPKLFKKLQGEIWEFRTKYNKKEYRLFAFWDKEDIQDVLVVATHGLVKKIQKLQKKEIEKADKLRQQYFEEKENHGI